MRVAVVHDWLTGMRGGERVLEAILRIYPRADLYTLIHVPGSVSELIEDRSITTSFVNRLPGVTTRYRYYLPLFPAAIEQLRVRDTDLVISVSHCVAKSIKPPPDVPHICYCNTPMRYVWEQYDDYFGAGRSSPAVRAVMPAVAGWLRRWDAATASRVTSFVSNSAHIRERIRRCYQRTATVIHPPVDVERFQPAPVREPFYLIVSALVPYKRIDLAVNAFSRTGRPLVVVGEGPERRKLQQAASPNVTFLGRAPDAVVTDLMQRCRAFVFPATEDFGITAVEAQAAGAPVIAHASGGALETVRADTGVFFHEHTVDSLNEAVRKFETLSFDTRTLRANAERFGTAVFDRAMRAHIARVIGASP